MGLCFGSQFRFCMGLGSCVFLRLCTRSSSGGDTGLLRSLGLGRDTESGLFGSFRLSSHAEFCFFGGSRFGVCASIFGDFELGFHFCLGSRLFLHFRPGSHFGGYFCLLGSFGLSSSLAFGFLHDLGSRNFRRCDLCVLCVTRSQGFFGFRLLGDCRSSGLARGLDFYGCFRLARIAEASCGFGCDPQAWFAQLSHLVYGLPSFHSLGPYRLNRRFK